MLFPLVLFLISVAGLAIAAYTDLKERIVPNRLSYSLIALGLALHIAYAFLSSDFLIAAYCIISTIYAFLFSLLLYKAGVWAGGDVKLFTGIAALNPLNLFIAGKLGLYSVKIFEPLAIPLFPLTLFVFTLFSMLPVTVFIVLKRSHGEKAFRELAVELAVTVALAIAWLAFYQAQFGLFLFFVFSAFLLHFAFKMMLASRVFLRKTVNITALEEGMIPAETIAVKNGGIERERGEGLLDMKSFINYIKQYKVTVQEGTAKERKVLADSRLARGLEPQEISKLKKLVKEGKLEDFIQVKESAPMVPAILAAYVALNLVGDLLWNAVLA
ncbi:MAG: prepilin peptidase [Candidatus Diapherotrites archaeon]|nr:prepilin peptidase [Candidatus Diapherotrites archaeon]